MGRIRKFELDTVVDRAVATFWEHGYERTPMAELCRAMGLQPGSVYAAFGDKRQLFIQCVHRYAETVSRQAVERIHSNASGLGGVQDYFRHLVDAMVDGQRRWGCLLTNSVVEFVGRDADLSSLFQAHFARLETAFEAALARARAAGELREGAGPADAALLVAVVQGMNVLAKTSPGREMLQRIADSAVCGLGAAPTGDGAGR